MLNYILVSLHIETVTKTQSIMNYYIITKDETIKAGIDMDAVFNNATFKDLKIKHEYLSGGNYGVKGRIVSLNYNPIAFITINPFATFKNLVNL